MLDGDPDLTPREFVILLLQDHEEKVYASGNKEEIMKFEEKYRPLLESLKKKIAENHEKGACRLVHLPGQDRTWLMEPSQDNK